MAFVKRVMSYLPVLIRVGIVSITVVGIVNALVVVGGLVVLLVCLENSEVDDETRYIHERLLAASNGDSPYSKSLIDKAYDEQSREELQKFGYVPEVLHGRLANGETNASITAKFDRGPMMLVYPLLDEKGREMWPFDVRAFERKLDSEIVWAEEGPRQRMDNGKLKDFDATMRYLNGAMLDWAVEKLDGKFPRVGDGWCWQTDECVRFMIESVNDAWQTRNYCVAQKTDSETYDIVARFVGFPRTEQYLMAALASDDCLAALGLGVLAYNNQVNRQNYSDAFIEQLFMKAAEEYPEGWANLAVLYDAWGRYDKAEWAKSQLDEHWRARVPNLVNCIRNKERLKQGNE